MTFALGALEHATGSVVDSGGPLVPFAMIEVDGNMSLTRFVGELAEGQQKAREAISASTGVTRAAVAWDGYLTLDGQRTDAVFVEASAIGDLESVVLAQRYEIAGRRRKRVQAIDIAALISRQQPLF
ncbi:MAG TPA: hypothetical protein VFV63_08295 [Ilumatobacteraceae bacterium]|nr:hypothetical protein [Ilumatobacteraceae bacterium]